VSNSARSVFLDNLRAVAILGVVVAHSAQAVGGMQRTAGGEFDPWMQAFFNQGGYGVQVFFFLSGFLLAMIYGFSSFDIRPSHSERSFWVKRFFRIWPLWAAFLIFAVVRPTIFPESPGRWDAISELDLGAGFLNGTLLLLLNLTFLMWLIPMFWEGVIPGGWSIQAEVLHYAFFALLRKRRLETILTAWLLVAIPTIILDKWLARVDISVGVLDGWRSQNFPGTVLFFLAGCIVYLMMDQKIRGKVTQSGKLLSFLAVVVVLFLPLNNVKSGQAFAAYGFVAFAIVLAYVLGQLAISQKFLRAVAKYSYFSYFFHFLLLDWFEFVYSEFFSAPVPGGQIGLGFFVLFVFLLTAVITTLVGALSWRLFEGPLVRYGGRLAQN
jgi:peptidoglycan/LPS O-acetylase OafA/YrhL